MLDCQYVQAIEIESSLLLQDRTGPRPMDHRDVPVLLARFARRLDTGYAAPRQAIRRITGRRDAAVLRGFFCSVPTPTLANFGLRLRARIRWHGAPKERLRRA